MSALIPLDFETNAVRTAMIDGKRWWVAADACRALDIRNPRQAVSRLDEDQMGVIQNDTLGGKQTMNIVSQSGLLTLVTRSDKPVAKRFLRWITDEVVPALLRDGTYSLPGADHADLQAKRAFYSILSEPHAPLPKSGSTRCGRSLL